MSWPYPYTTRSDGTVLDESVYNGDHDNHITHQEPTSINDYSDDVAQMRLVTDPAPAGVLSMSTSTAGELERLRYSLAAMSGNVLWYAPPVALAANVSAARISAHVAASSGASDAPIAFNTRDYGPTTMVDLVTNHSLIAPVAGYYRIGGQAMLGDPITDIGAGPFFSLGILVNGTGPKKSNTVCDTTSAGDFPKGLIVSVVTHLAAGDYVQLVCNGVGTLYVGQGYFPALWMSLIGT